ncbi:hypothetical protein PACTADRAFT_51409 [Pachysolen tannophilus NRRL Y-2460]|uniref:O-acyltransferase n=1 Tax=Pachysolen tannophilus NRRL Y-2460 TaxID=669874 RepID=A0A1E4TPE7_PACTA|nr:hypothetical protein PACTADRAFT_51409 [Pachysolen tannophilus NRRL Y-2460]
MADKGEVKRSNTELKVEQIKSLNKDKPRKSVYDSDEYSSTSVLESPTPSGTPPPFVMNATEHAIKHVLADASEHSLENSTENATEQVLASAASAASGASGASGANVNGNSLFLRNKKQKNKKEEEGSSPAVVGPANSKGLLNPMHSIRYDRDGKLRSRFSDVKFVQNKTIFESEIIISSKFYGFYILFWFAISLLFCNTLVHYHLEKGSILNAPIMVMLKTDLIKIGLTDLLMYLSMYGSFFLQLLIKKNFINWNKIGLILQNIYQFFFLFFFLWFAEYHKYSWIGKVFLCLHSLVMLMKMHSYAFYNGYLWNITEELNFSKNYLLKYKEIEIDFDTLKSLKESINFCEFELNYQTKDLKFPNNICLNNFFQYTMFPTVVYVIEYPRTKNIRWNYVLGKILRIFGTIFIMVLIAQTWIYPLSLKAITLRSLPMIERIKNYPLLLFDLMTPFLAMYLAVWYLIWELILNAIAELSMFADRRFYGEWWNCVTWDEFARLWNIPVHEFLLRHVYHSSISALKLSKMNATFITFFLSSLIHELVMFVIFGKLRGYLLLLQMFQLPLVSISRSKYLKDKKIFGNIIFWFGIATGPSLMCSLYLTF